MERNVAYPAGLVTGVQVRSGWAQVELFSGECADVQAIISGDEHSVKNLIVRHENGKLIIEQPTYGLSLDFSTGKWMQIVVCVPHVWRGDVALSTVSSPISVKNIEGGEVSVDTVAGTQYVDRVRAESLSLSAVTGALQATRVTTKALKVRNVSGTIGIYDAQADTVKVTTAAGDATLTFEQPFVSMDVQTATGAVRVTLPGNTVETSFRSVTGKLNLKGFSTGGENAPLVSATSVTGDVTLRSKNEETEEDQ